ncbi:Emopamil binding protein-domain-containing protein [Chaetomium tenue]|uniref:Emopamil binding protein-domain-containing protein n=1 Tax=Chaetomium tenue TaxID=1854479 RepID=A0ACB7PAK6_9PEZI|nr:Emopamil binding protein-domain-containing protein [Chaetomium globosum]
MSVADSYPEASMASHPYFPPDLELPGYMANPTSVPILLALFAAGVGFVFSATIILARVVQPNLSKGKLYTVMWFMLCGCIHLFFEGYFAYHSAEMPARIDVFGQLWKEYSKSDHRYLTRDGFTVCMETVTAVAWGPLSFLIGWLTIKDHPLRYPLQLIVSLGQIYGDVLYMGIFFFDEAVHGAVYCRPERFYFWVYYVMMNGFWFVIPGWLLFEAVVECTKALRLAQETAKRASPKSQ